MAEQIEMGDMTITLHTAWTFLSWPAFDDYGHTFPKVMREGIEAHRGHAVMVLESGLGWRKVRCQTCDVPIWDVHDDVPLG